MIDPHTQAILQDVVRRESRSLLLYIGDAFPWTAADGAARLAALRAAIKEVADAATAVGRFLVKNRASPPPLGAYPAWYTSWNFLALSFLVPKLLEAERASIDRLEADRKAVKDPAARAPLDDLLKHKQHALSVLDGLLPTPQPAAAS